MALPQSPSQRPRHPQQSPAASALILRIQTTRPALLSEPLAFETSPCVTHSFSTEPPPKGLTKYIVYFVEDGVDKGVGVWADNEYEAEKLALDAYAKYKKKQAK